MHVQCCPAVSALRSSSPALMEAAGKYCPLQAVHHITFKSITKELILAITLNTFIQIRGNNSPFVFFSSILILTFVGQKIKNNIF